MEARAKVVPGLPRANATISCWQDPPQPIAELHSTPNLPKDVDFVVIGSGISGACIALNLIEKQPDARLLMLEARQACSGATGRNDASIFGAVKAATGRMSLLAVVIFDMVLTRDTRHCRRPHQSRLIS